MSVIPSPGGGLQAPPAMPDSATRTISGLVVRLLRQRTARGAAQVRTEISSDLVTVTLRNALTTAEKTLAARGHGSTVTHTRRFLYEGVCAEASEAVEQLTGSSVTAYLSDQVCEPDLGVLVFILQAREEIPATA